MGCCCNGPSASSSNIEIDIEEAMICVSENTHPFSEARASALFREFWTDTPFQDWQRVLKGCESLRINDCITLSSFEYLESIQDSAQSFNTHKLLLHCILLGRDKAEDKLELWLNLLPDKITWDCLTLQIQLLIEASVASLPLLAIAKFKPGQLEGYIDNLLSESSHFVTRATRELADSKRVLDKLVMRWQFDRCPVYLDLFTPSLARLLLKSAQGRATIRTRESNYSPRPIWHRREPQESIILVEESYLEI